MIELTYDRDARMLYCYFAAIEEGEDAAQVDVEGRYLLDGEGQIVALSLQTEGVLLPDALRYALGHDEVAFDQATGVLDICFTSQPHVSEVEFPFPAICDLERNGRVLGVEVVAESEFAIGSRLRYAEPYIVETFGEADDDDDEAADDDRSAIALPATDADDGSDQLAEGLEDAWETSVEGESDSPAVGVPPRPIQSDSEELIHAGFVALLGKPNVGKSTLLNAYLGQKVSIVSPKPQTTRIPVRGILNSDTAQVIFVDTPGLHTPRSGLGEYMVQAARRAIPDSDVLCFVVDASEPPSPLDAQIAQMIKHARKPALLVLNKIDVARKADVYLQQYRDLGPWDYEIAVSAKTGDGLSTLLDEIVKRLPHGPRLFPADQLTDVFEREQVAELIREKVLLNTAEEVPHGVAVEVDEWTERGDRLYIRATVNVEREGHKGILIGERGTMLKKIGAAARYEIERLLKRPVYLDLWIKVRKDWRRDPASLRWLGYNINDLKK